MIVEIEVTADSTMHTPTDYLAVANATRQAIVRMHIMGIDIEALSLSCSATVGSIIVTARNCPALS